MVLWGEIFKDRICVVLWNCRRGLYCGCPEQEVGYVDVGLSVFFRGVTLKVVGDCDCQSGLHRESGLPCVIAVNVGEGNDIPSDENFEFVSELSFASGGEPYIGGHEGCADDGCLFGFDEGYFFIWVFWKQVLSEETLGELPVMRQDAAGFEDGVYPCDTGRGALVFDAVACGRVVFHYLACAAVAVTVNLKEDDAAVFGDAEPVFGDDSFEYERVEDGAEVRCKGTVDVGSYGPADILFRDGADLYWRWILGNPVFGLCGDESTPVV